MFKDLTLEEFFKELSSGAPTPGGGTVGALCGAIAASLGAMVAALSQGGKYVSVAKEMQDSEQFFLEKKNCFLRLADEDAESFKAVMLAYKMPKDDPVKRKEAIQSAMKGACQVPAETSRRLMALIPHLRKLLHVGNRSALSDVGTALSVSKSGLEASSFNLRINLLSIQDDDFKKKMEGILTNDCNVALAEIDSLLIDVNTILKGVN